MDALTLLQSVPIFANACADELASLAQQGQFVQLASGECLYRENDPPRHFFVLASGVCRPVMAVSSWATLVV